MDFKNAPSPGGAAFLQWKFIYSFHMPLFYFLSGALHKRKSFTSTLCNSMHLVFLAQLFHVVGWITLVTLGKSSHVHRPLFTPLLLLTDFTTVVLWFLVSLAIIQILFHIVATRSAQSLGAVSLLLIGGFVFCQLTRINYFQAGSLLPGFIFYWLGSKYANISPKDEIEFPHLTVALASFGLMIWPSLHNSGCVLTSTSVCANKGDQFGVLLVFGQTGFWPYFITAGVIGCFATLSLAHSLTKSNSALGRILSYVGQHSLEILIVNGFVLALLQPQIIKHLSDTPIFKHPTLLAMILVLAHIAGAPVSCKILKPIIYNSKRLSQATSIMVVSALSKQRQRARG